MAMTSHFLQNIFVLVNLEFIINLGAARRGKLDLLALITFSSKWKRNH